MSQAQYLVADKAVEAYDAFVFTSVGREFNQGRADVLAWVAADECKKAARDKALNHMTQMYYHEQAKNFVAIIAD